MNILHIDTEPSWRGGERQCFLLARELETRGHHNVVACRPGSPLAERASEAGLAVKEISPLIEADPWALLELRRQARLHGVDICHGHTGHGVTLAVGAAWGSRRRACATRRVDFPLKRNLFSRWKYARLDGLAVISRAVERVVVSGGYPAKNLRWIPSGIDLSPQGEVAQILAAPRVGKPGRKIVHVGALVPHKDQATLIKAMSILVRRFPDAHLDIFGEGPLREVLAREIQSLGLQGSVRLAGYEANILQPMREASVFVLSSKEEGLGTVLLDALALGVPTAATQAGGIPEMYEGGADAPELSPVGDPQALADNITRVLQDPEEARRRVARGRECVKIFDAARMAESYEKFYNELLAR